MEPVQRKAKKRIIQVAGNPQYAPKISVNKEVMHPTTGLADWGQFPEIITSGKTFPDGPIRLRYGEHKGPESGFGLAHIWEARKFKSDVLHTPMLAIHMVANLIMAILKPGTEIFYEHVTARRYDRATVFKNAAGTVILEERVDSNGNAFYSIVTAIPNANARGTLIGVLP